MAVPAIKNMTLRDYFAGQALVGFTTGNNGPGYSNFQLREEAEAAYALADAMLAARKNRSNYYEEQD